MNAIDTNRALLQIPLLLIAGLMSGPSLAVTIDDFSTPQGPLVSTAGAVTGAGIIGGSRELLFGALFEASGGIGTFGVPMGSGNAHSMRWDGQPDLASTSSFPSVDLTDGGLADTLIFSVVSFSTTSVTPPGSVFFTLWVTDADSNLLQLVVHNAVSAIGLRTSALPVSGIDLTRITQVEFGTFVSTSPLASTSIGFDFICTGTSDGNCTSPAAATVPEPGSLGLLLVGLTGLVYASRRGRNRHS